MNVQVDLTKAKLNHLEISDFEKLVKSVETISKCDLCIDDTPGITIEQLEEKIKEVKPDVVIIDYFELMSGNEKKGRFAQIEEIGLGLKRITKENKVIIFAKSKLSRALESRCDKRPMLSDFRAKSVIKNLSDVVIFLYRDDYYDVSIPEKTTNNSFVSYDDDKYTVVQLPNVCKFSNEVPSIGPATACAKVLINLKDEKDQYVLYLYCNGAFPAYDSVEKKIMYSKF